SSGTHPLLLFSIHYIGILPVLHSFPTRRSSDLVHAAARAGGGAGVALDALEILLAHVAGHEGADGLEGRDDGQVLPLPAAGPDRSEEHTSELQSRENLVCRLLLEKKKNKDNNML